MADGLEPDKTGVGEVDDLALRFVAMCARNWIAKGLPSGAFATACLSHGMTAAVEVQGHAVVAASLRRWATVLTVTDGGPVN